MDSEIDLARREYNRVSKRLQRARKKRGIAAPPRGRPALPIGKVRGWGDTDLHLIGVGQDQALPPTVRLARPHTVKAFSAYVQALGDPDPRIQMLAADRILDRGWGRVPPSDGFLPRPAPLALSREQLEAKIAAALERLNAKLAEP